MPLAWDAFRDRASRDIGIEWCEENDIPYVDDPQSRTIARAVRPHLPALTYIDQPGQRKPLQRRFAPKLIDIASESPIFFAESPIEV